VITTIPAVAGSLAVVALAVAWVRPVAVTPACRPRELGTHLRAPSLSVPCPGWFADLAHHAALSGRVERWWTAGVGAVVATGALGWLAGGPVFGVLVLAACTAGLVLVLHLGRGRRQAQLVAGIPDSLDAVARSVRAGSSVVQALGRLDAPTASSADLLLVALARRVERGEALADAVEHTVAEQPSPAVRLAMAALAVAHETGAPPGRAVEGVAATLRDRAALEREARANASQARASAGVLVVAPVAFSVFAIATDPRVGDFLFRSWIGWLCLALGVLLDIAGALWMRSIMAAAR
jgi:tight adherence protein B